VQGFPNAELSASASTENFMVQKFPTFMAYFRIYASCYYSSHTTFAPGVRTLTSWYSYKSTSAWMLIKVRRGFELLNRTTHAYVWSILWMWLA